MSEAPAPLGHGRTAGVRGLSTPRTWADRSGADALRADPISAWWLHTVRHVESHDPLAYVDEMRLEVEAEARKRVDAEEEEKDVRWVMSGPRGRSVVWRLIAMAAPNHSPFHPDTNTCYLRIGLQEAGRKLQSLVQRICPDEWAAMVKEHNERSER